MADRLLHERFGTSTPAYPEGDELLIAYASRGRYDLVRDIWAARVQRDPGRIDWRRSLAATYFRLGQTSRAIETIRATIRERPAFREEGETMIREVTSGSLYYLKESWVHEGFSKGTHHWIYRHNQYSTDEVILVLRLRQEALTTRELLTSDPIVRRRALKKLGARLPFRPLTRFVYIYILRGGFLDGAPGFIFCLLRFAHDIHIVAKLAECRKRLT